MLFSHELQCNDERERERGGRRGEEMRRREGVPRCSTLELEPDKETLDKSRECIVVVPLFFSETSVSGIVSSLLFVSVSVMRSSYR